EGCHDHFRQIDSREEVDGHALHTGHSDYEQGQADHDDEVRVADRKAGHGAIFLLLRFFAVVFHRAGLLRTNSLTGLESAAITHDDEFSILQSGLYLHVEVSLNAGLHFTGPDRVV